MNRRTFLKGVFGLTMPAAVSLLKRMHKLT